jgi:hypothetical protein
VRFVPQIDGELGNGYVRSLDSFAASDWSLFDLP